MAAVALWLVVWQAASVAVRQQLILPGPVDVAAALVAPGDSVLLDEPFAGLDTVACDLACDVIADELRGRSLIVATHDARDAGRLGADTLVLGR